MPIYEYCCQSCGHNFEGPRNRAVFTQSPLWAFGKARPEDFPPPCEAATMAAF